MSGPLRDVLEKRERERSQPATRGEIEDLRNETDKRFEDIANVLEETGDALRKVAHRLRPPKPRQERPSSPKSRS